MNIKTIGEWIQAKRIEQNMTPGQFGEQMGIASALVKAWENDAEKPNKKHLEVMAKIFRMTFAKRQRTD